MIRLPSLSFQDSALLEVSFIAKSDLSPVHECTSTKEVAGTNTMLCSHLSFYSSFELTKHVRPVFFFTSTGDMGVGKSCLLHQFTEKKCE